VAGYWGDGGAATNANLSGPAGVTLDPAGNILITDLGNNRIRMITPQAMVKRSGEMEIEFEIVPNTVNMTLEFKFNAPLDGIVKVLDMEGNVKEARNVRHETTVAFDVKTYAAGFYMYEVQTGGKTRKGKFRID
jgi:DNA-binding beta-propeller fold protein YncE